MGKPTPNETTAAASSATVIRAEPGKAWPEPPSGGTWSRDPQTGDLTLVTPPTREMTPEERQARREKQRAAALKASNTNAKE